MVRLSLLSVLRFSLVFFVIFNSSCRVPSEDSPTPIQSVPEIKSFANVDPLLWSYFEEFENEGFSRGFQIDLNLALITGKIEEIDEQHVAGQCTYSSHQPNHVTIDKEFWDNSSDLFKEFIIFHELGHCYLARDHREDAFSNGTCKSLMRSGVGECRDNYNASTRKAYLDELFKPDNF